MSSYSICKWDNVGTQKYTIPSNHNAIRTENIGSAFCAVSTFSDDTIIEIKFKVNAILTVESFAVLPEINVTKFDICNSYYSYVN